MRRVARPWPWYARVPLKLAILATVSILVLFPDPRYFFRQVARIRNLERMVTPDAPELAIYEATVRARCQQYADAHKAWQEGKRCYSTNVRPEHIARVFPEWVPGASLPSERRSMDVHRASGTAPADDPCEAQPLPIGFATDLSGFAARRVQQEVAQLAYSEFRYAWDWEVWGVADYMPTIAELFAKARESPVDGLREDCDGRAVFAASLMRRLGYDARVVTDLRHVWVETPEGKYLHSGQDGPATLKSTPEGNALIWTSALLNIPVALNYGIAVFPFSRELIITITIYLLLVHRAMNWRAAVLGGLFLIQGLLFMRFRLLEVCDGAYYSTSWPAWIGITHVLAGVFILMRAARLARRRVTA